MHLRLWLLACLLSITLPVIAQFNDNSYRNSKNKLYWQNRKPHAAYWQQDVHYKIDAGIDEGSHIISASEELEYWNNSPDTLHFVYFHLFQNAFVKGSYLHSMEEAVGVQPRLGGYEAAGLGTVVKDLTVDGKTVRTELDNTIMKVYLPKPLLPKGKMTFKMRFQTYYDRGGTRRRMQMYDAWGFKHYNGVQWFPKICVYDSKFGWDTYQHLNKEFYGEFGSYDVSLNFPSNYIVEATGALQNREEVLPDTLREKLDIKNFANKKWNEPPSTIIPYVKGERKVWKFYADNVHDFAFTADPSYRIGTKYWNGVECIALAQEPHAAGWQNGADYVAKIIKTLSEEIGMYAYPKMIAADANDGMEYPMLTLDGGSDPGYRGLLVHEIAHNWFYGMVGSNETYRSGMDEGFAQYYTAEGLRLIDGDTLVQALPKSKYRRKFYGPTMTFDYRVMNAYHIDALTQNDGLLNVHANGYGNGLHHENGYRSVYYKSAAMLSNLQYTLGDSLYRAAMQHYFYQWKFAHPYFEDFRNSIIQFTHVDLNWFFDQWWETNKTIDYSVCGIRKIPGVDSFAIKLRRNGKMEMPIDLTVQNKQGQQFNFYIPNTWFEKNTSATTLPRWFGLDKLNETYEARVQVPGGISKVQIDTSYRLADVDLRDNVKSRGITWERVHARLDGGLANPWDRKQYRLYIRPDIWWNPVDGIKAGVHVEGDYMFTLGKLDATVWYNTHVLQSYDYLSFESQGWYEKYLPIHYSFNYSTPLSKKYVKLQMFLNSRILDGLSYHRGGFNWNADANNTLSLYGQTMWRPLTYDLDYLIYTNEWSSTMGRPNSSINASWSHNYKYKRGAGNYVFSLRAPFLTGNSATSFDYGYLQVEAVNYNRFGKLEVRTRLFGRYGMGTNIPYESALFLAGANPEELMEDKYTRSVGFVPNDWRGISRYETNHFQQGGGLNLRGYAGYFVADERDGQLLIGYKGRSGVAGNVEIDFDNYIPLRPRLTRNWLHVDAYAFADAGVIELSKFQQPDYYNAQPTTMWSDLRIDAGVGFAFTIKKWGVFDKANPLTLRFDMPLFINRPPYTNPQYANFRYVVGVNRTF